MLRKMFWIASICILTVVGLRPVFSYGAPPASSYKVIYSFTGGVDGGQPMSDLTLDSAGNLYGTTSRGGANGNGTVFKLKHSEDGWKEEVLYSFAGGNDGGYPAAGVIFDRAGNLYGTTFVGGEFSGGTAFKLTPNSRGGWTESVTYSFNPESTGYGVQTDLVVDAQGNLYGAAAFGVGGGRLLCYGLQCGTVFELTHRADGSWTEITLHVFNGAPEDGGLPSSGLVIDSLGNLYGTTELGGDGCGIHGCGIVYELTPSSGAGWSEDIILKFLRGGGYAANGSFWLDRGRNPSSRLIVDHAGQIVGTTSAGGNGIGTVFELVASKKKGWKQNVLYRFYGNPDGEAPTGRLEMDLKGDLFGVTSAGGTGKVGTVFEVRHSRALPRETVLHSFGGGSDGASPKAGLVSDSHGNFYGTTNSGGISGAGTVYVVAP
jgi:uncharacterized repeat protein (TIGR03803 family)